MKQDIVNNIRSIGLLFGPDFFHILGYSDFEGSAFTHTVDVKILIADQMAFDSANPLYSFMVHPNWTLIPSNIFREEDSSLYLKLNTGFSESSEFTHEEIVSHSMVLVYERDQKNEEKSYQIKPNLQVKHLAASLIDRGKKISKDKNLLDIFIFQKVAYLFVWKSNSLLLGNGITVEDENDLLYFVMYTLNVLSISTTIYTDITGTGDLYMAAYDKLSAYMPNLSPSAQDDSKLATILSECA